MNGAGQGPEGRGTPNADPVATDGEDYTDYEVKYKKCGEDPVTTRVYKYEPRNHFGDHSMAILGGKPTITKFRKFYKEAVDLWRKGFPERAAFILGRALHLVEDMAQPQHAMGEWHLDKAIGRYPPDLSFLEEFVEGNVRGGSEFCPRSQYDYSSKISLLSPDVPALSAADPSDAIEQMRHLSTGVGNYYIGHYANFTTDMINNLFGPSVTPPLCSVVPTCGCRTRCSRSNCPRLIVVPRNIPGAGRDSNSGWLTIAGHALIAIPDTPSALTSR